MKPLQWIALLMAAMLFAGCLAEHKEDLSKCKALLAGIEKFPVEPGQMIRLEADENLSPGSPAYLGADYAPVRGQGRGLIWAARDPGGRLQVFIETDDKGHAGEFGFAYTSDGKPPVWNADIWGELWTVGEQVEANWWVISYRLG